MPNRSMERAARARAGIAFIMLGTLALAGCTGSNAPAGPCTYAPTTSFMDVHGLAVNPEHPDELYVATHGGLIRGVNGTGWARVGPTHDDLMGFSAHPTNGSTVWSSGHPGGGFGNLGVRVSRDGGCSWQTILTRDVDFHAMTVSPADPDHLWGFYRSELQRSTDGGHTWNMVSKPAPILSMAADPKDSEVLYAATQQGVAKSADGGATWSTLNQTRAAAVAVDPTNPAVLYMAGEGFIARSGDGGVTWSIVARTQPGATFGYLAINPKDPRILYAATYQAGIYKSTDAGSTWSEIKPPSR